MEQLYAENAVMENNQRQPRFGVLFWFGFLFFKQCMPGPACKHPFFLISPA